MLIFVVIYSLFPSCSYEYYSSATSSYELYFYVDCFFDDCEAKSYELPGAGCSYSFCYVS